jgi:ferredoxin-NADP reductase
MVDPSVVGVASGAALLGAAAWQAVRSVGRRRQHDLAQAFREQHRRHTFDLQLDAALRWAQARHPRLKAWAGTRPFRVAAVVDESADCRSFYLAPEDGRPLPRFEPGQYLTFHLPSDDRAAPLIRCYSLSDRPREDYYRVTVRWVDRPELRPDLPPGRGSGYFHREVRPGARLDVEAPQGSFFLDPTDARPVALVGAGIGVTPLVSMAAALAYWGDPREVRIFVGFRDGQQRPLLGELVQIAASAANMHLDVSFSQPRADDVAGRDFHHQGRADFPRLRAILPSNNFCYYVCGPPSMMESVVPALAAWGVPEADIHYEAFGPASVRRLGKAAAPAAPCDVLFARSGKRVTWTGAAASLLDLAEQSGVRLDAGCRAGNCGACRVTVASGSFAHLRRPGAELADGECLACLAVPQGDVVIDA